VLGLFTWSDDPAYAHREVDIECSRWGNTMDPNNAQFVVQPFNLGGHLVRYPVPPSVTNSTHLFTWETNRLSFQSQRGAYSPNPAPANIITNWSYSLTVPQSGDENARINLWLMNGNAPTDSREVEVIIRSFQFVPLGKPAPAVLTNFSRMPDGRSRFEIDGQMDRRYTVQQSMNVVDWQDLVTLVASNNVLEYVDANPMELDRRLFRALTLP